jgi:hypothetical protein
VLGCRLDYTGPRYGPVVVLCGHCKKFSGLRKLLKELVVGLAVTELTASNINDILRHVYECDYRRGFGLDIGFTDHFNTQTIITLNYSAIADLHTLQFTRAHVKYFPACSVFTNSCLATASNNDNSSASRLKSSLKGGSLPTDFSSETY